MRRVPISGSIFLCLLVISSTSGPAQTKPRESSQGQPPLIWKDPGDISSRNLRYGSGGEKGRPRPPVVFEKEDRKGSNPKFDARDQDGEKWKVKLGVEARPETAATRLLWAVGYFTENDYLLPELQVKNLGKQQVEVTLIGKGKSTGKITQALPKHELLVTGGNAANATSWFVVLRQKD